MQCVYVYFVCINNNNYIFTGTCISAKCIQLYFFLPPFLPVSLAAASRSAFLLADWLFLKASSSAVGGPFLDFLFFFRSFSKFQQLGFYSTEILGFAFEKNFVKTVVQITKSVVNSSHQFSVILSNSHQFSTILSSSSHLFSLLVLISFHQFSSVLISSHQFLISSFQISAVLISSHYFSSVLTLSAVFISSHHYFSLFLSSSQQLSLFLSSFQQLLLLFLSSSITVTYLH